MFSLIVFLVVLGVLIFIHELGHFLVAKKVGVRVQEFCLGFGRKIWSKKKDYTEYSVAAIPLGGYVKMAGDNLEEYKGKPFEYFSKKPWERALIIFCGPFFNYILGFLCFWLVFYFGYPTLTSKVGEVVQGLGAQQAGVMAGDKIVSIDGTPIKYWEELQAIMQAKKDSLVAKLVITRDGQQKTLDVNIKENENVDLFGKKYSMKILGVKPSFDDTVKIRHSFAQSFVLGAQRTWDLTVLTYNGLWWMITGKLSVKDSVTGPLGIFVVTSKVAGQGLAAILNFMGLLSISLAIFNLLPLPILDGGHILLLGIEKIRGKGIGIKAERVISRVGITLIITLAIFVTYNDVARIFGERITKWFIK